MSKKKTEPTYSEALEELNDIQEALENNEIPIDQLTEKVKRAGFLLTYCQNKLRETEDEVNKTLKGGE
ncbi:exodeoxyribonuclease VII small subunit [Flammeovirgaceae bacterium SG7u.111]|nr:exodeoxyribonuclease VII small subunit [Flammeovirgaceae bacterium SG7u.132]WPO37705.1 exodeoxyribonuclease VII small subunit [Flammeovirgaceae bacterium SG7u.111]